jgi:hypothetical protein
MAAEVEPTNPVIPRKEIKKDDMIKLVGAMSATMMNFISEEQEEPLAWRTLMQPKQQLKSPRTLDIEIRDGWEEKIEARVLELEKKVSKIEKTTTHEKVVIIEEMDMATAKTKVSKYMKKHKKADTEELMENLKMDLRLLVDVLGELKKEGKLKAVDV